MRAFYLAIMFTASQFCRNLNESKDEILENKMIKRNFKNKVFLIYSTNGKSFRTVYVL